MGKQVAARMKEKTMSRKRPHEGTAGHDIKQADESANPYQQGSAVEHNDIRVRSPRIYR